MSPAPVTAAVNEAVGTWFWLRRKMPESMRTSSGALMGPPPGVVSRKNVRSIRVIWPMVALFGMKIGRLRGVEGLDGSKRLVILSARIRWLPQAASGQFVVDGTDGGVAVVQVWVWDQSFSLRRFEVS